MNLLSNIQTIYLQINMVKYKTDQEIMITNVILQIVRSQFFTDMLIFFIFRLIRISFGLYVFGFD